MQRIQPVLHYRLLSAVTDGGTAASRAVADNISTASFLLVVQ